ncbi:MAG TPA: VIT1/CCC1 transporter family protein [Candidatus Nanoarchaeia archaeon]|nr:hypothetical protein [uncultured archaeon]
MELKVKYTDEELKKALRRKQEYLNQPDHTSNKKLDDIFHHKNTGRYIGDLVYGANDGIITTFAVVSGATGASFSPAVIVILGFANLLADGFSMASSSFLSIRSSLDYQRAQRQKEEWEVDNLTEIEVQEVRDIYSSMGFSGDDLDKAVKMTISDRKRWVDLMMVHELGIFEETEDVPWKHGLATFGAFALAGLAPLIPFIIPFFAENALIFSAFFAAVALFTTGALRTLITIKKWWVGGLEMLFVGTVAGFVSFAIGLTLKNLFGL